MQSKWLTWQPGSVGFVGSIRRGNPIIHSERDTEHWSPTLSIIENTPRNLPTKPSKPSSVGFVGSSQAEISITPGRLTEQIAPGVDANRAVIPSMPPGVCLLEWKLKEPPVAIETCAVVTDPGLFARTTLEQFRIALTQPERWVGWSVSQLLDRLAQVGVLVTLETESKGLDMEEA